MDGPINGRLLPGPDFKSKLEGTYSLNGLHELTAQLLQFISTDQCGVVIVFMCAVDWNFVSVNAAKVPRQVVVVEINDQQALANPDPSRPDVHLCRVDISGEDPAIAVTAAVFIVSVIVADFDQFPVIAVHRDGLVTHCCELIFST
jgi:hypothetical protein